MNSNAKYNKAAKAMVEAFLIILSQKEIDCVSVKEICDKAGVNRSTFYLHYDNISDLIADVLDYIRSVFHSFFEPRENPVFSYQNLPLEDLIFMKNNFLVPYLEFTKRYKFIFLAMVKNPVALKQDELTEQMYSTVLKTVFDRFGIPEKAQKYMLRYHLCGIRAIIQTWITDDCADSVDEMANIIKTCVLGRNNPITLNDAT